MLKRDRMGPVAGGRSWRSRRSLLPILIERTVTEEPIVVEPSPGKPPSRPAGFWRGAAFHRVMRLFGRRFERDALYVRVLSDRGQAFELRRTLEIDPRTWENRWRWDLLAVIAVASVPRLPSDSTHGIPSRGAGSR